MVNSEISCEKFNEARENLRRMKELIDQFSVNKRFVYKEPFTDWQDSSAIVESQSQNLEISDLQDELHH